MTTFPALFLSHGSPMLAVEDSLAGRFLDGLAAHWPKPRAIVVASAHYPAAMPAVGGAPKPATVHDFNGFPAPLYALDYPAPGDPVLAERIAGLWREAGLPARVDPLRGLDHGVWVPLRRMYPAADIPVLPLAVDPRGDAAGHLRIGRALAPLRDEGVLLVGSGGFVHNLGELDWQHRDGPATAWARAFADWMHARLLAGDTDSLRDWRARAPHAPRAHPTVEHLMPLFFALGASGDTARVERLHHSEQFGSLALDAYAFH